MALFRLLIDECFYLFKVFNVSLKMTGRQMKYPYTFTAKLAMFPWKHHFSGHWIYKYTVVGIIAGYPVFAWLNEQSNNPSVLVSFRTFPNDFLSLFSVYSQLARQHQEVQRSDGQGSCRSPPLKPMGRHIPRSQQMLNCIEIVHGGLINQKQF